MESEVISILGWVLVGVGIWIPSLGLGSTFGPRVSNHYRDLGLELVLGVRFQERFRSLASNRDQGLGFWVIVLYRVRVIVRSRFYSRVSSWDQMSGLGSMIQSKSAPTFQGIYFKDNSKGYKV